MSVDFELDAKELNKYLESMKNKTDQVKEFNKTYGNLISVFVFQDVINHFEKEEGQDGPWAAWSPNYKRKSGQKLQDTGRMRNAFQPTDFKTESEGFYWFNNAETKDGFPYAYAHDNDEEARKQLPQRSFMWLSEIMLEKIGEATLEFITGEKV